LNIEYFAYVVGVFESLRGVVGEHEVKRG
jgi:hypothetical protein